MQGKLLRRTGLAAVGVALLAAGIFSYRLARDSLASGELAGKAGWSALQGIEHRTRGLDCGTVTVQPVGDDEFLALGFPAAVPLDGMADGCRSWVLLDEHAFDRRVKQMPRFRSYRLPCSAVADLPQIAPPTDAYVVAHLESICSHGPFPG
jgi:hypothetical protein